MMPQKSTDVSFDIEVLKIERVLPDIDTNDRSMAQQRVLVGRRDDLEAFIIRVKTLHETGSVH